MTKLSKELKRLCYNNPQGSYGTQRNRLFILTQAAKDLQKLRFTRMSIHSLKEKHVLALFSKWHNDGLSKGTISNRLSHLRWWSKQVGKSNVLYSKNEEYYKHFKIKPEKKTDYLINKSSGLDLKKFEKINDPYTRLSLLLQENFGLRKSESLYFSPSYADKGNFIRLKSSWTKGGRARDIPIINNEQRQLIDEIKKFVGGGSLIQSSRRFIQQAKVFEAQTSRAGISNVHGLRHAYAQRRYLQITGWPSPKNGGPSQKTLNDNQKIQDKIARQTISNELGHNRLDIVSVYI